MKISVTKQYEIPDDHDCKKCKYYIEGRGGFGDRPDECTLFEVSSWDSSGIFTEQFVGKPLAKCRQLGKGSTIIINQPLRR